MKLLIVTQAVDTQDPVLGFFVRWIEELSNRFECIEVICLKEGKYDLPQNVRVYSLGKERGRPFFGAFAYGWRFLALAWRLRNDYDAVFVHMNQEYVLLAGWLWKLLDKRIYLWRNHYAGSWLTNVAAAFCEKVFCTSKHSYTAKYKKTVLMPVGVDTERFKPDPLVERKPRSILFLARISPSKRPEMLLDALATLARENVAFTATFVGSPLPKDESYYEGLQARASTLGLGNAVSFLPGVPNSETPKLYRTHEIFVNTSPSGMLDKTIFEAAASGCIPLAASQDWTDRIDDSLSFASSGDLVRAIGKILNLSEKDKEGYGDALRNIVSANNLETLVDRIAHELSLRFRLA